MQQSPRVRHRASKGVGALEGVQIVIAVDLSGVPNLETNHRYAVGMHEIIPCTKY